jgi:membrane protease YdiL (CAAX protease family)
MEQQPTSALATQADNPLRCQYCGAMLASGYYFCLSCATPYRSVETVLPAVRVARPDEGEQIRLRAPHAWPLFWTYLSVVVGGGIAGFLIFRENLAAAIVLSSVGMFITTCIFGCIHYRSLWVQLNRIGFNSRWAWLCLAALAPMLLINYGYTQGLEHLLKNDHASHWAEAQQELGLPGMIFLVAVLPAIVEELAFRGLLLHWLAVAITPNKALILSSALFMALHFSILSAPYLFAVGMLLGFARLKTGSLYPSMLIHFLHNLAVVVLFPG